MILPRSVVAALFLIATVGGAGAASLDYDSILGLWCGSQSNPNWTNYRVSRDALTVIHLPQRTNTVLRVDHFEFSDDAVVIYYLSAGHEKLGGTPGNVMSRVQFINFSPDGQQMTQATSDVSGEYRFTRCGQ